MENPFNSDLEQVSEESPSNSLVGLLDSAASPNLKEVFRDKTLGCCAVDLVGEKLVIHSEIFGERTPDKLRRVREASLLVDEAFRMKGVEKLYTWAVTDEQYRFNQFLGYRPNGNEVFIEGYETIAPVYEFEKDL